MKRLRLAAILLLLGCPRIASAQIVTPPIGGGGGASLSGTTTSVGFNFSGTVAASSVAAFTCVFSLTIPTNFASPTSAATCGTNPAESDAYTVKVNGVTVGTITLSTSCVATLGAATTTACAPGQRMEIDAPVTVSGQNIAITIAVTR